MGHVDGAATRRGRLIRMTFIMMIMIATHAFSLFMFMSVVLDQGRKRAKSTHALLGKSRSRAFYHVGLARSR